MSSSPSRHPGFLIIVSMLLGGVYWARSSDPVEASALEQIEARYVAERADCLALEGAARRDCKNEAERRQQTAQHRLDQHFTAAGVLLRERASSAQ